MASEDHTVTESHGVGQLRLNFGGPFKFGTFTEIQAVTASNDAKATERSTFNFGGISTEMSLNYEKLRQGGAIVPQHYDMNIVLHGLTQKEKQRQYYWYWL